MLEDTSFPSDRGTLALVQSGAMFLELLLGIPTGFLINKYGARFVSLLSALALGIGFILSATAPNGYFLYFSYTLLGGIGLGFGYGASSIALGIYFTTNSAAANAIAGAGIGAGTIALSLLISHLVESYSWRFCFRVLGFLCLISISLASLVFVPIDLSSDQSKELKDDMETTHTPDQAATSVSACATSASIESETTTNKDNEAATAPLALHDTLVASESAWDTIPSSPGPSGLLMSPTLLPLPPPVLPYSPSYRPSGSSPLPHIALTLAGSNAASLANSGEDKELSVQVGPGSLHVTPYSPAYRLRATSTSEVPMSPFLVPGGGSASGIITTFSLKHSALASILRRQNTLPPLDLPPSALPAAGEPIDPESLPPIKSPKTPSWALLPTSPAAGTGIRSQMSRLELGTPRIGAVNVTSTPIHRSAVSAATATASESATTALPPTSASQTQLNDQNTPVNAVEHELVHSMNAETAEGDVHNKVNHFPLHNQPPGPLPRFLSKIGVLPAARREKSVALMVWTDERFWAIAICLALYVAALTVSETHLGSAVAIDADLGNTIAAATYTVAGLAGIIGRFALGLISLIYHVDIIFLVQVCGAATGVSMIGLSLYQHRIDYLMFYSVIFGALGSVGYSFVTPILAELFGLEGLPFALGGTYSARAPLVLFAAPIAGWIRDSDGHYENVWFLTGSLCVLSALPLGMMTCKCTRTGRSFTLPKSIKRLKKKPDSNAPA